jgi:hypothetical protein
MTEPSKRRVVIRLTPRQKEDGADAINAVREALSDFALQLCVRTDKERREEDKPAPAVVPDEALETSARRLAQAVLDAKASEVEAAATGGRSQIPTHTGAANPADPSQARKTLWQRCRALAVAGWTFSIGAVVEYAYMKITGRKP